jgi:hypothetical protein
MVVLGARYLSSCSHISAAIHFPVYRQFASREGSGAAAGRHMSGFKSPHAAIDAKSRQRVSGSLLGASVAARLCRAHVSAAPFPPPSRQPALTHRPLSAPAQALGIEPSDAAQPAVDPLRMGAPGAVRAPASASVWREVFRFLSRLPSPTRHHRDEGTRVYGRDSAGA